MAVRKRDGKKGASWQIDYLDPNGRRVRRSFKKKRDAEAELGKRVSLIAENRYLDVKKDYTTPLRSLLRNTRRTSKARRLSSSVKGATSGTSKSILAKIPGWQISGM